MFRPVQRSWHSLCDWMPKCWLGPVTGPTNASPTAISPPRVYKSKSTSDCWCLAALWKSRWFLTASLFSPWLSLAVELLFRNMKHNPLNALDPQVYEDWRQFQVLFSMSDWFSATVNGLKRAVCPLTKFLWTSYWRHALVSKASYSTGTNPAFIFHRAHATSKFFSCKLSCGLVSPSKSVTE